MATSRLQVLMSAQELKELRKLAQGQGMTVADWVRQAIRSAARRQPSAGTDQKLAALQLALQGSAPTGDVEQINAEIEHGYLVEPHQLERAADEPVPRKRG